MNKKCIEKDEKKNKTVKDVPSTKQAKLSLKSKTYKLNLSSNEYASKSNDELQEFRYGVFKDNALTYLMRTGELKRLKYLLKRNIDPTVYNKEGLSSLHFVI